MHPEAGEKKRPNRAGTYYRRRGHWYIQVTGKDGTRSKPMRFPGDWTEKQIADKTEKLAALARGAVGEGAPPKTGDTVATWFTRWFDERKSRGVVTADGERGKFTKWVVPALGPTRMVDVTEADLEDFVERLDRAARAHAQAEAAGAKVDHAVMLSWKSAFNVWTLVRKGFEDAHRSKTRALRVLARNPAADVRGPDKGATKVRNSLSPAKFLAFVSLDSVPLLWRQVVTFAVYTYLRASELRALRWADVRLDEGVFLVHRTIDAAGDAGTTKSEKPRRVPIEPALVPLLVALRAGRELTDRVVELIDDRHLARALRTWLVFAGLDGPELERSATQAALTWHDLRGSGITWRACRGDDPLRIMVDAGHEDFETTRKYIRLADLVRAGYGDVFPELPSALLSSVAETSEATGLALRNHWRRYGGGGGNRTRVTGRNEAVSAGFSFGCNGSSLLKPAETGASATRVSSRDRAASALTALGRIILAKVESLDKLEREDAPEPFWVRFADERDEAPGA